MRCLLFHESANASVKVSESWEVRVEPGLVDRLDGEHSWVVTPSINKTINSVNSPVNVLLNDRVVALTIPVAHPLTIVVVDVVKMSLIKPLDTIGHARVVVAILGSFDAMNVKQDLQVVLLGGVENPLDLVFSTISAANIRAILAKCPVAKR